MAQILAPSPFAIFEPSTGNRYTADASGNITVTNVRDLNEMLAAGCEPAGVNEAFQNLTLGGLLYESTTTGIIAGTTRTQAGATPLTKEINRIDTSTAPSAGTMLGDGVVLMASVGGLDATVINNTANTITIYPLGTDTINGLGAGLGIPVTPYCVEHFECPTAGAWYCDAGVGFKGALNTVLSCDGVVAAGVNQAGATALPADVNRITAGSGGVMLPASAAGLDILIINHTGGPIQVYASNADLVDDIAGSVGVAQMNGSLCLFACATTGNWYSNGIGTGYAGAYPTVSYSNGLTAFAGGGQASAVLLSTALNRVTTVVTSGDSVKLPIAIPGMQITVFNASANSMNVFPNVGDAINVLGANAAYALASGKTVTFFTTATGFWHALLSA